ncbi:MAG: DUF456 domain-containing protein [Myxococcota bacterium]
MEPILLLWIVVVLLVAVGIAGAVLPGLPGAVLVFGGLALGAWIDGFAYVGQGTLAVLAVLAVLTYSVDFAASALGAQRAGAHRNALIGAAVGALVGLFFGLPGILLGPFIGAVIGEYTARGDLERAGKVGFATWLGMAVGSAAKLALTLSMVALFLFQRFA